jgi:tetratricopeptide (TPR) repeat protein
MRFGLSQSNRVNSLFIGLVFVFLTKFEIAVPVEFQNISTLEYVLLSGRVVMDDGSALPLAVRVGLFCEEQLRYQTATDVEGNFTFEINNRERAMGTWTGGAGRSRAFNRTDVNCCEIRLISEGPFTSNSLNVSSRSSFDDNEVGEIVLSRRYQSTSTKARVTSLTAPSAASKALQRAEEELAKDSVNYSETTKHLKKAVQLYPEYALAWEYLGQVESSHGYRQAASEAFEQALKADPKSSVALRGLLRLAAELENWAAVEERSRRLLDIVPQMPEGLYYRGLAEYYLGRYQAAEKTLLGLNDLGYCEVFPLVSLHLGLIHTRQGRRSLAACDFRQYLEFLPEHRVPLDLRTNLQNRRRILEEKLAEWEKEVPIRCPSGNGGFE